MKLLFVLIEGFGFVAAAMCTAFVGAASQWGNSTEQPSQLQWYIIWAVVMAAGFGNLVAFTRSSFGDYLSGVGGKIPPGPPLPGSPLLKPAPLDPPVSAYKKITSLLTLAWISFVCVAAVLCGSAFLHHKKKIAVDSSPRPAVESSLEAITAPATGGGS